MNELIMDVQTGFQKGRQMSESYIYAQHLITVARKNKMPFAMLKLDIKKAFDTISWDFVLQVMKNLGFQDNWITWVKNAVLQGSSQVLINGLLGKRINLKRGVRQGDSLSPSLFIMAMDFFARYLQKLTQLGAIRLPFPDMRPCLLYADDALLFLKPDPNQAQAIKLALLVFQQVSGLAINLEKTELLALNTLQENKIEIAAMLNCRLAELPMTYLGIPLSDKRLPKSAYLDLLHKFSKRLGGWASRFLSIAGRLTLLNSILSSLPVHFMSVLKLPEWVILKIDKIRRNFLWHGVTDQKKGFNLVDWEVVCTPKQLGGLGVLDLRAFNKAMLLKWFWWWFKPEQKLWKPLITATVGRVGYVPDATVFMQLKRDTIDFFYVHTEFQPGKGTAISLWDHDWGKGILRDLLPALYSYSKIAGISLQQGASSHQQLIESFMPNLSEQAQEELQKLRRYIDRLQLIQSEMDNICWKANDTGVFSVQSAYKALKGGPRMASNLRHLWKLKAPPRMIIFGWLAIRNRILTHDNLKKKGCIIITRCPLCKAAAESVHHLFQNCDYTKKVYTILILARPSPNWPAGPVLNVTDRHQRDVPGCFRNQRKSLVNWPMRYGVKQASFDKMKNKNGNNTNRWTTGGEKAMTGTKGGTGTKRGNNVDWEGFYIANWWYWYKGLCTEQVQLGIVA
ncbi:uncharacterized protein LOC144546100 [Carex rostrata]